MALGESQMSLTQEGSDLIKQEWPEINTLF